jgi:hypothetical protein
LERLPGSTKNALKNLEKHGCKITR